MDRIAVYHCGCEVMLAIKSITGMALTIACLSTAQSNLGVSLVLFFVGMLFLLKR